MYLLNPLYMLSLSLLRSSNSFFFCIVLILGHEVFTVIAHILDFFLAMTSTNSSITRAAFIIRFVCLVVLFVLITRSITGFIHTEFAPYSGLIGRNVFWNYVNDSFSQHLSNCFPNMMRKTSWVFSSSFYIWLD